MDKQCPKCGRTFKANADGSVRRHWCHRETGDSRTVQLVTGGHLTISLAANWMLFDDAERQLLGSFIDLIEEYESKANVHANGDPALQGAGAGNVSQGASADAGDDAGDDGAGPGPASSALEVSRVSSSVSADICHSESET